MKLFKTERETSFQEQVMMDLLLSIGNMEEDPLDYVFDECRGSVKALLEDLRIPRTRNNTFRTKLIAKYQSRQKQVESLIREMFVRGSVRAVNPGSDGASPSSFRVLYQGS